MIQGILLGLISALSLVLTFNNIPDKIQVGGESVDIKGWVKQHKLAADVGAFLILYFSISTISKSIVALVAATVGEFLIGVLLHASDIKKHDPELYEAANLAMTNLKAKVWSFFRQAVFGLNNRLKS